MAARLEEWLDLFLGLATDLLFILDVELVFKKKKERRY